MAALTAAGVLAVLVAAAPALADVYSVVRARMTPPPRPRARLVAADGLVVPDAALGGERRQRRTPSADFIGIGPFTVQLNAGELAITDDVTIAGSGADVTTVGGNELAEPRVHDHRRVDRRTSPA